MNKLQRFLALLFRPLFYRLPDPKTVDRSGIVNSDHPKPGNGWLKGFALDVPERNIIVVAKHAGPGLTSPRNSVFVRGAKGRFHELKIVAVDAAPFEIVKGKSSAGYYNGSDIAICRIDQPLPADVQCYKLSTRLDNLAEKAVTFDQDGRPSIAQIRFTDAIAWIKGRKRLSPLLRAGDSGLPWFVWEDKQWKVLTHTTKGQGGEGPWYAHPLIRRDFEQRVAALSRDLKY